MNRTLLSSVRNIIAAIIFLLPSLAATANHIVGMDLSYTHVSGNTYRVTLTAYGDCGVGTPSLATSVPNICVYNGNTSVGNFNLAIVAPTTGTEITPVCPASIGATTCSGGTIPGVRKYVYEGTYTLSGTSQYWRFIFNGVMGSSNAGRATAITNTTGVTVMQLIDSLDNRFVTNSTTTFTNDPTPYFCLNNPNVYTPGGVDPNGDSLVYTLVSGKVASSNCGNIGAASGTVTYTGTAWPGQPVSAATPIRVTTGDFTFNQNSGRIAFTPNATQLALVVYNVREYRAGVLVGSSQREMSFLVQTCTVNPPDGGISAAVNSQIVDATNLQVCAESGPFSFHLLPLSTDPTLNIKIRVTGLPVGATFNVVNDSTPNPDATFSWTSTGVTPGLYTINVTFRDDQCPINGSRTVPFAITINNLADITGTPVFCEGSTTTLADVTPGGTWSSSTPAIATVTSGGVVSGNAPGTAIITYSVGSCFKTMNVTVNPMPGAITGTAQVCVGLTTALASSGGVGTWSSSLPAVGTIGVATGVAGGIAAGTATISYTLTTTGCTRTTTLTVNALPGAVTGSLTVCQTFTTALSSTPAGGTWSEASPNISVVAGTGVVTGTAVGTGRVTYTSGAGCIQTAVVTVNGLPNTINPPGGTVLCVGNTANFTDGTAGGTWQSSNTSVATVGSSGSPTTVTAIAAGTATISYILTASGCFRTKDVTVNTTPAAITPASPEVCTGNTIALSNTVAGGVWSSSNPARATVDATSGLVTALPAATAGTVNITYAIGTCTVATTVTVYVSPAAITGGVTSLCAGDVTTWTSTTPGGVWSSANPAVATVNTTGVVTGVALGTATISYTTGICSVSRVVTVGVTPAAIFPSAPTVCAGSVLTFSNTVPGGTWSSANTAVATFATPTSGIVTGVSAGTSDITYSIGGCYATVVLTVNTTPVAAAITGPAVICVSTSGAYANTVPGGVWSTTTGNASISAGGIATGITMGADTIRYTVTTACGSSFAVFPINVNPLSDAGTISGPSSVCVSGLVTLTSTVPGGVWSSSNSNATVGSSSGVVTGVLPGIDTISYTVSGTCGIASATRIVTIDPLPSGGTITGPGSVCVGAVITLTSTVPGGTWSVANTSATITAATGVVTGVAAGTNVVTYTVSNACGTATATTILTINPLPDAGVLSGPDSVCVSTSITLTPSVPGGVWSAGNANATVVGGLVSGVSVGTVPISYTVTNVCASISAIKIITVAAPPTAGTLSGPSAVCIGAGITLTSSAPGGVWSSSNGNATISGPGVVVGSVVGTSVISYTVTNLCGVDVATQTVSVNPVPTVAAISGPTSHCVGSAILLTNATAGGNWTSSNMAIATVGLSTGIVTGLSAGVVNITYTVTNGFGCPATATAPDTVLIVPVVAPIAGNATVCIGSSVLLTSATGGGVWSSSAPSTVAVDAAGNASGNAVGTATISYTVTNICGVTSVSRVQTVLPLPVVSAIAGPSAQCAGTTITLTSAPAGGVWSSSDISVADIGTSSGDVLGVSAGTADITYTYTDVAGCSDIAIRNNTVNALPVVTPVTGATSVCVGTSATLSSTPAGGVWTSSNVAVATIDAAGSLTGVAIGTTTVSYTYTDGFGCAASASVIDTVVTGPASGPLTGTLVVCEGSATMLMGVAPGGTWASSDPSVATVDASGNVTGVAAGTAVISYEVSNSCATVTDVATVTVNATPSAGTLSAAIPTVCAGGNTAMSSTVTGGVWSSGDVSVATVGSSSGIVTAVSAGPVTISYTVTIGGCSGTSVYALTIGPAIPGLAILPIGSSSLCNGNPVNMHVSSLTPGLTYQWYKNGVTIAGATNSGYITDSVGTYSVIVSNGVCSQLLSGPVVVFMAQPVIGFNPPNLLFTGSYATYQWYRNGVAISGANSSITPIIGVGSYKVVVEDANGCRDTSAVYYVSGGGGGSTGVTVVSADDIRVYPNPAASFVNIDAPVKVNVYIVAADGRKIAHQDNAASIDVSRLAGGLYMIMIYDENNVLLKAVKFVKSE